MPLTNISQFITLPLKGSDPTFCSVTGIGETRAREMIKTGELKAVRIGKKRILVVVQSYLDLIEKQMREGSPDCDQTQRAIEVRKARRVQVKAGRPRVDLRDLNLL